MRPNQMATRIGPPAPPRSTRSFRCCSPASMQEAPTGSAVDQLHHEAGHAFVAHARVQQAPGWGGPATPDLPFGLEARQRRSVVRARQHQLDGPPACIGRQHARRDRTAPYRPRPARRAAGRRPGGGRSRPARCGPSSACCARSAGLSSSGVRLLSAAAIRVSSSARSAASDPAARSTKAGRSAAGSSSASASSAFTGHGAAPVRRLPRSQVRVSHGFAVPSSGGECTRGGAWPVGLRAGAGRVR